TSASALRDQRTVTVFVDAAAEINVGAAGATSSMPTWTSDADVLPNASSTSSRRTCCDPSGNEGASKLASLPETTGRELRTSSCEVVDAAARTLRRYSPVRDFQLAVPETSTVPLTCAPENGEAIRASGGVP